MVLNAHSYYSLRYGTLSVEELVLLLLDAGYTEAAFTDINNTSGTLDFVKIALAKGLRPLVGMDFREKNIQYVAIARNNEGYREINELRTRCNLRGEALPFRPEFKHCYLVYPIRYKFPWPLSDNERVGVAPSEVNLLATKNAHFLSRCVVLQRVSFRDAADFELHRKLRAVQENKLLSRLKSEETAPPDAYMLPLYSLLKRFENYPQVLLQTKALMADCTFSFDFETVKNRKLFGPDAATDREHLRSLAFEGMRYRYGTDTAEAETRIRKELEIIDRLGFNSYFLISHDIICYSKSKGYYHVGRGSGANSVVAYCLGITDVCPIELDLYFERFLNPKRKSPPDFDIDYSWRERDDVLGYIFKKYGNTHTALLGAMSTFRDNSIIRELGKVYGLPKADIDRLADNPASELNDNDLCRAVQSHYKAIADFPNVRSIHAGGVLISELPLSYYTSLDLPPKGFPTTQFDMYLAEDIAFEKLDILSQRGIGHIREASEIIQQNRGIRVDVYDTKRFKSDSRINEQLRSSRTIGCFYIESPAMRGLLSKLRCNDYLTLVAASSIIRPGVSKSGMMKAYIQRFHQQTGIDYLHPVMEQQLKETYGVMVYQEDVLKVGHHYGGLDLADADVLRRMMSGKYRHKKHLDEIKDKFFGNAAQKGYPEATTLEVWRQMESFAGYSFSKAHSASYAVESYQSLFLKTYFPIEFMVAVINNFGGFYATWLYVNELQKEGATVHIPCVNKSTGYTTVKGTDVYLGFAHVKDLEHKTVNAIVQERNLKGPYSSLDEFVLRTRISLEQLLILLRLNALRFTGIDKKVLMWEAHALFSTKPPTATSVLFNEPRRSFTLPRLSSHPLEAAYDEIDLLGFPVSISYFDLLKTAYRSPVKAYHLTQMTGQIVRILGRYVTEKYVRTITRKEMRFGTFLDDEGNFFDTVNFPRSLEQYPFTGRGIYLILGKVVSEFGFPSVEVSKMAKLPLKPDPREGW